MVRVVAFVAALAPLLTAAALASSEDCIELAYLRPHTPQVELAEARLLVRDVNAARAQRGLHPLVQDDSLSQFALQVAEQMAQRHYFGHTDPNGVTFQDRLRASHVRWGYAAENMAFDQDEAHANQAFLHSPGHYANIVDGHPHRVGTAVVAAGDGEVFYVEEFAD
ncbi:MAG TPA: CAP domain-containing protein [Candidatus Elarobacter sp.]|nr:CAP domain-containing protein [Candidatus Elarobacter sp.]